MKIPPHAQRVFKGVIFDVYHWPEQQFDGSNATWEALKRKDSVQIIATRNGKIILVREEQPGRPPFYGFLGGQVEPGDEPLATAKRELIEEGGLVSNDWELLMQFEPSQKMEWTVSVYIARECTTAQEPDPEPGERIELKEMGIQEFYETLLRDDFRAKDIAIPILHKKLKGEATDFERKLFPQA